MLRTNKIYIIPTRFGAIFAISSLAMVLVGATYGNNMINLLAYFLMAIGLIAMVQTHNNLKNVQLQLLDHDPGFAGGDIRLITALENTGQDARFSLDVRPLDLPVTREPEIHPPLLARGLLRLSMICKAPSRGRYPIKRVRIATIYPLGLFYAWMWLPTEATILVYPQAIGDLPFPEKKLTADESTHTLSRQGEDFHGHRRYQPGDSPRRIDWKALARGNPLLVKEFDDGGANAIDLDWFALSHHDLESRLSQLTAWVEKAHTLRLTYSLRLPHITIPPGDDIHHRVRCLEELALYEEQSRDQAA